jgi:hypothetical protein
LENNNKPSGDKAPGAQPKAPAAIPVPEPPHAKPNCRRADKSKKWEIGLLIGTLIAAGTAAYYTRKQWRTADDQERRSLRAYVLPDKISVMIDHPSANFVTIQVLFKNFGLTPAIHVRDYACVAVRKRSTTTDVDVSPKDLPESYLKKIVVPNTVIAQVVMEQSMLLFGATGPPQDNSSLPSIRPCP